MIEFQDFVPEVRDKGGFFRMPTLEQLSESLGRANDWIAKNEFDVINVETVVLPNIHVSGEEGSTDTQLRTAGETSASWHQFIRVWYRTH
jgi:hypothetical protein